MSKFSKLFTGSHFGSNPVKTLVDGLFVCFLSLTWWILSPNQTIFFPLVFTCGMHPSD